MTGRPSPSRAPLLVADDPRHQAAGRFLGDILVANPVGAYRRLKQAEVYPGFTGLPAAMQLGNSPHMGNIADMDRTSTKWSVRFEQARTQTRVLRTWPLPNHHQY